MRDLYKKIGGLFSKGQKSGASEQQAVVDAPAAGPSTSAAQRGSSEAASQPTQPAIPVVSQAKPAGSPIPSMSYSFNLKPLPTPAQPKPVVTPPTDPLVAAVELHKQGRLSEAEACYLKLLGDQPGNADIYQYIGMLHLQRGEVQQGVARIREALTLDPNHFAALSNLGNALLEQQDCEAALPFFQRAVTLRPDNAVIRYGMGRAHLGMGKQREAVEDLRQTLAQKPDFPEALSLLAKAHYSLNEFAQASEVAKRALAYFPKDPHLNYFCGLAVANENARAALAYFEQALQSDSTLAEVWYLKGRTHQTLQQAEQALAAYQKCLTLQPDHMGAAIGVAASYKAMDQNLAALKGYDDVLEREPQHAQALADKGAVLAACGKPTEARALIKQASELLGDPFTLALRHAIAGIPRLRHQEDRLDEIRSTLESEFVGLLARVRSEKVLDPASEVGLNQPFFLAYQDLNNRHLLSLYGDISVALMKQWADQRGASGVEKTRQKTAGKHKIGIFTGYVFEHSVWRAIVRGWVRDLDRSKFELHLFYCGTEVDQQTRDAQKWAEHFYQGDKGLAGWADCIEGANLDVLIYPEVGMDVMSAKLASLRLAPVQMGSWGHPETTGLKTLDYYLSADLFESSKAQEHYSEKLIPLPNLGCCFESMGVQSVKADLAQFGIEAGSTVFVCPGTSFKYAPEYDQVFARIIQHVPSAKFVFFSFERAAPLPELLIQRIGQELKRNGMDPSAHLRMLPWQSAGIFYGILKSADVFLDTIGFSGFNTVMHGIECGIPIVTIEGTFMRGRFGSGILRRAGLGEYVCADVDQYVDLAVRLAQDASLRDKMAQQIASGRKQLYGDKESVRGLESALLEVIEAGASTVTGANTYATR